MRILPALTVVGVICLPLAAGAQPAQVFTMVCSGTLRHSDRPAWPHPVEPWSARVAIDLTAKTFCVNACGRPKPLLDFSADGAVLTDFGTGGLASSIRWVAGDAYYAAVGRIGGDPYAAIRSTCTALDVGGRPLTLPPSR